jgi:hypothetical protein
MARATLRSSSAGAGYVTVRALDASDSVMVNFYR